MSIQSVLLPVLVQVGLIFFLLGFMAKVRGDAFKSGTRGQDIALSTDKFPPYARQVANAFANQFEIPILFFLAVIFAIVLHRAGWLFVLLEWLFVGLRIGQAYVAMTSNDVRWRGPLFLGAALCVFVLWTLIFVGVYFGTSLV